jgi:hypothetical protein
MNDSKQLLRHTLATLAYRGGKALRGTPPGFAEFRVAEGGRAAGQLLAHVGDLLDWGLSIAKGHEEWHNATPRSWDAETERFFAALEAFDAYLSSDAPLQAPAKNLFQGPIADALTHVGQLAMMRRLSGAPISGENYFVAEITVGRVGPAQAAPKQEF